MIKAKHNAGARLLFNFYIERLLKRSFHAFNLVNFFPDIPENKGLIITPNHFSWWDGFFIDYVCKKILNRNFHIMMLENQLKRYWFFKYIGAFSINQNNPKSIAETFNYTISKVKKPANVIIFYPQGEIEPYDSRPFTLKKGIQLLLKKHENEILVVPAAFKIQFEKEQKPFLYARFGMPVDSSTIINNFKMYETSFNINLDELDNASLLKGSYINLFDSTNTKR